MSNQWRSIASTVLTLIVIVDRGLADRVHQLRSRSPLSRCRRQVPLWHIEGHRVRSAPSRNRSCWTIREDGSYDIYVRPDGRRVRGKGKIAISDGRLQFEGEKGAPGNAAEEPAGDLVMNVEATLSR